MFNALRYIKNLEETGIPRQQAEAQVQLVIDAIEEEVVTKGDFSKLGSQFGELGSRFNGLETRVGDLDTRVRDLDSRLIKFEAKVDGQFGELRVELAQMENRVMLKLGTLMIACMTLQTGVLGLLLELTVKH